MREPYSILICSCDKFSDLWEWNIRLLYEHWKGNKPDIYLVTDKPTKKKYDGVTLLWFDGDFPTRLKSACELIKTEYVLLTLDDYFLIKDSYDEQLVSLVEYCQMHNVDYMLLYDRRYLKEKDKLDISQNTEINVDEKYSINLYPAIWKREFLCGSVRENVSPWEYEVQLSEYGRSVDAKCYFNHAQVFYILDVVRKGKLLNKANRYLKSNGIDIGTREKINVFEELKLDIMFFINWHFPENIKKSIKMIAVRLGMKFYSKD